MTEGSGGAEAMMSQVLVQLTVPAESHCKANRKEDTDRPFQSEWICEMASHYAKCNSWCDSSTKLLILLWPFIQHTVITVFSIARCSAAWLSGLIYSKKIIRGVMRLIQDYIDRIYLIRIDFSDYMQFILKEKHANAVNCKTQLA